jgi:hypothetical protein
LIEAQKWVASFTLSLCTIGITAVLIDTDQYTAVGDFSSCSPYNIRLDDQGKVWDFNIPFLGVVFCQVLREQSSIDGIAVSVEVRGILYCLVKLWVVSSGVSIIGTKNKQEVSARLWWFVLTVG